MRPDPIEELRTKLGLPAAPLVLTGLRTASDFFRTVVREDPLKWWQYLRGIDFHRRVEVRRLPRGTKLVRYESLGDRTLKPFSYFTESGTSPFSIGTSFPAHQFKVYEAARDTAALVSTASGLSFSPTDRVSRLGGGTQYIIAFADLPALVRVAEPQSGRT